jgi:hypothetical protein
MKNIIISIMFMFCLLVCIPTKAATYACGDMNMLEKMQADGYKPVWVGSFTHDKTATILQNDKKVWIMLGIQEYEGKTIVCILHAGDPKEGEPETQEN